MIEANKLLIGTVQVGAAHEYRNVGMPKPINPKAGGCTTQHTMEYIEERKRGDESSKFFIVRRQWDSKIVFLHDQMSKTESSYHAVLKVTKFDSLEEARAAWNSNEAEPKGDPPSKP